MKLFSRKRKRNTRLLQEIIVDIDSVIVKVHRLNVDFAKGSIHQRVVDDLDGARVSARASLHFQEQPDVDTKAQSHPRKHPD
jgi:hypothetical protein